MSSPSSPRPTSGAPIQQLASALRIVLRERRLPGKCYLAYYRMLHALGRKTHTIRVARGVRLKGFTTSLGMAQEVWRKRVYDQHGFTISGNMNVVDIGANQGFFTVYAATQGANVYAFEPSADNFSLLQHNLVTNRCADRVKAFRAAVSGTSGETNLFIGLNSHGEILSGSASIMNANRGGVGVKNETVPAVTFADILKDNRIGFCDLLKMDCEGAEYDILKSMSPDVLSKIGRVSMETHSGRGREAFELLKSNGFKILDFEDSQAGFIKAVRTVTPFH